MLQELRYTVRGLLRAPGHSVVIVITLALAIGATTTIYSVVNGVLLRPLPFAEQDRLVMLWQRAPGVGVTEDWFSPAQYFDIREGVNSFEHSAITWGQEVTLTGDEIEPTRLGALRVSSSFFDVMGISPTVGRRLGTEDDLPDAPGKVLLGHQLYTQQFGSDPDVVGRSITLDGRRLEIVGVMPPLVLDGDIMPTLLTVPMFDMVLSFPLEDPQRTTRGSENFNVVGKLAPGATLSQLDAELLAVARRFAEDPGSLAAGLTAGSEFFIGVVPLLDQIVGGVRRHLLVLLGATAVLLAIACANVANLQLTRASARRREISIRASLGAQRSRMVAHAMVESAILSVIGGAAGLGIALAGVRALHVAAPDDLPRLRDVAVDPAVLLFAALLCTVSSLLFGLGPALQTSRVSPGDVLREGTAAARARSVWRRGGSRLLVIAQVALSLLLLIGAGLLVRTFGQLRAVDPGFRPEGVLSFRISLVGERYQDRGERLRFFDQLWTGLLSLPNVEHAGGTTLLPLTRGLAWTDFIVEDFNDEDEDDRLVADVMTVTPGYFEAMGIPLLSGRTFNAADTGDPPVVLVNRHLAELFWGAEEAVGKWVATNPSNRMTILGVVDTVKHYGLDADTRPAVFFPYARSASRTLFGVVQRGGAAPEGPQSAASRDGVDETTLTPAVVRTVRSIDPDLPVYNIRSMPDRLGHSLALQRVLMWLLNFFGGTALTLATVGLYGVLSFAVATHTREIGIRKALGAQRGDLYRLVLKGAAIVTGLGIVVGVSAAFAASRAVEGLVYGVGTGDPVAFVAAIGLVVIVGLAASLLPARRAADIDPMVAVKQE